MTPRALRRAAERAALKAARKQQAAQPESFVPSSFASRASAEFPIQSEVQPETQSRPEPKTISAAQYAANQANAQLSSGPKSLEGKAISSRNHTQHGLTVSLGAGPFRVLPNEDQSEYDRTLAAFAAEWKPVTATENDLVERLAVHYWLRCRAGRLQDERLALGMNEMQDYKQFEVYARYHTAHLRGFNKAFADLMRLRNFQRRERKDEAMLQRRAQDLQIRFESQKRKAEEHAAKMEATRLKQEARQQRNQHAKVIETAAPATENAPQPFAEPALRANL